MSDLNKIINAPGTTIVDVRTPEEFESGNVEGSINIPLNTIPDEVERFRNMEGDIVLCCRSGQRSGQALLFLEQQGVKNLHNAGGYTDVLIHKI